MTHTTPPWSSTACSTSASSDLYRTTSVWPSWPYLLSPFSSVPKLNKYFCKQFFFQIFGKKLYESAHGLHWHPLNTPETRFEPTKPGWATSLPLPSHSPPTPGSTQFCGLKMNIRGGNGPYGLWVSASGARRLRGRRDWWIIVSNWTPNVLWCWLVWWPPLNFTNTNKH